MCVLFDPDSTQPPTAKEGREATPIRDVTIKADVTDVSHAVDAV